MRSLAIALLLYAPAVLAEPDRTPAQLTPWQRVACAIGQRPFHLLYDTFRRHGRRLSLQHQFVALYHEVSDATSRRHFELCLQVSDVVSLEELVEETSRTCERACATGSQWEGYFRDVWFAYRRRARHAELDRECRSVCAQNRSDKREWLADREGLLGIIDAYVARERLVFNRYGSIVSP